MYRFAAKGGIFIRQVRDEDEVICVSAVRKGRDRKPCEVGICVTDKGEIILRTEDISGTAPIVVVLDMDDAELLGMGLLEAKKRLGSLI